MNRLYRIANWEKSFETCETKKLTYLKWVPIPNKHDGLGFRKIAAQPNCCELFSAWTLILQVASKGRKGEERGLLIRQGAPLNAGDLGMMTGFPVRIFEDAFRFFSAPHVGWLTVESQQNAHEQGELPGMTGDPPAEGNGMEGREENESAEAGGGLSIPEHLCTVEFMEAWGEWVVFRKGIKRCKNWQLLFQSQLKWLSQFPVKTAEAIVGQSIRNGWQGLFEIKGGSVGSAPKKRAGPNI